MEGRKEGIVANASKMKLYGFTLEMISDITGLTMEEVRDLEPPHCGVSKVSVSMVSNKNV